LIKNEFNQWKNHQIELLKMLADIRTRLKRTGQLSAAAGINMFLNNGQVTGITKRGDLSQTDLSDGWATNNQNRISNTGIGNQNSTILSGV